MTLMSSTASTTTHFAQYLKVNGKNSFKNIIAKRKVSIIHEFFILLKQYRERGLLDKNQTAATCKNLDYLELLNSIPLDESVMVYADPPYFKEHYSRYYHILNTVCKYDYPAITLNPQTQDFSIGRYREDRNISDFGKRKTALSAFRELINLCARNSAWLTISYSDNSVVNISDILEIMHQQYTVDIVEIPLRHSNQGRVSTSSVREYLLTGQPISLRKVVGQKQVCQLLEQLSSIKSETDNPAGLMHNYMARKPYNVVNEIIQQLCPKDGIVYDPMVGSGTTLIEASKLGYRAIATDINPLAYRITKISLTNWNIEKLKKNINHFYDAVERECNALYEFEESNEIRVIERCHFNKNKDTLIPISYWYKVREKTKLSPRKKADSSKLFTNIYQQFFNMPVTHVSNAPLIPNSRIAIGVDETVRMYFCARNLIVLDKIMEILKEYNKKYGYEVIELMVSSAINLIKLSDKKASSQMPYWIPKNNVTSRNAVMVLKQKRDAFLKGLEYLAENCRSKVVDNYIQLKEKPGIIVKAIPAQNMSYSTLPRDSVDLVLTDPPYTDQVPYLEYGQLWTSIMKWDKNISKKLLDELVVSDAPSRNKGPDDFNTIFKKILKRTANSLKEGGHFVMFYHTFDLKSWDHILSVMQRNGFAYQGQAPIASPRKSFKTIMSPNSTLDGNYIIVFRKRKIHSRIFEGTLSEAETLAINCAKDIIRNHAHTTSQDLYDCGMLKDAVEKGYLGVLAQNYPTFIDIIFPHFDCTNGIWREKECIGC